MKRVRFVSAALSALLSVLLLTQNAAAQMRVVSLPGQSPLVTFRIVFTTGSAAEPEGRPGVAYLTAMMLARSGTSEMTYQQVLNALFPMASSVNVQVDKEMCAFSGATHADNLEAYYKILHAMLLSPGWREDDFQRVKDDAINYLRVSLRSNNDEELGKEVLEQNLFRGTSYENYAVGTAASLRKISLEDVKQFYRSQYSQTNLILGIAGGYSPAFLEKVKKDFRALPVGTGTRPKDQALQSIAGNRVVIIDKDTRSVAYSLGFPLLVTRAHPDYPALLLAASYLGQHRDSGGVLFNHMREKRGLNYGDYAYIEYFPRGMFQFEPSPNLARRRQIFQIWIRPVEPPSAAFALRLALYELDKVVKEGISEEAFRRSRDFLSKYVNLLTRTKSAELGYAIDSLYYGIPNYNQYLKTQLMKLTRDDVNHAIQRHWRADRLVVVAVSKNGEDLKRQLTSDAPSPMTYNSPKPVEITEEDKIVEKFPLHLRPEDVSVEAVDRVFE